MDDLGGERLAFCDCGREAKSDRTCFSHCHRTLTPLNFSGIAQYSVVVIIRQMAISNLYN
ncbi:hypothetical protein [Brunnivagina elsteri]|uniref:hypothetical protein n=1 Tax=Brunnivagina elsteri TaxID=1247191 RepID=UPI001B806FC1|nr:hypothetical protein [Calothrix elsteri]